MVGSGKEDIIQRLRKVEGQVKGIQRMINEDKYCVDILVQIAAVRAAINKVGVMVFDNYTRKCLETAVENHKEDEIIDELIQVLTKFTR